MFRWVIGILVITLLSVGGISTSTRIKTAEVSVAVDNMKADVIDMRDKIDNIEKTLFQGFSDAETERVRVKLRTVAGENK